MTRIAMVTLLGVLVIGCQQSAPTPAPAPGTDSQGSKSAARLPDAEDANPAIETVKQMMRAKLAHAQGILEGVATQDMKQVESNANALIELSERASWQVHRTMEYGMYSEDFRFAAKELVRHAKDKKVHAATMDYMQMTMTCVRCHDYMWREQLVGFELGAPRASRK